MSKLHENWPDGPWDSELDELFFRAYSLHCALLRHKRMGHWCGYVAYPEGVVIGDDGELLGDAQPHGGVTLDCKIKDSHLQAQLPLVDRCGRELWVAGFDCAHGYDIIPSQAELFHLLQQSEPSVAYRTFDFVLAEVQKMAEWLAREVAKL